MIDATPSELIYVSLMSLHIEVVSSGDWQLTDLHIHRVQVDNQTSLGQPVLLGLASVSQASLQDLTPARVPSAPAARQAEDASGGGEVQRMGRGEVERMDRGEVERMGSTGEAGAPEDWFLAVRVAKNIKNASLDSFAKFDVAAKDLALDIDERLLVKLLGATQGILKAALSPVNEVVTSDDIRSIGTLDLSSVTADR